MPLPTFGELLVWESAILLNSPSQFVRESTNIVIINAFANRIPPRPRAIALDADYTTWNGLSNRTYTGRILPANRDYTNGLPRIEDVLGLFARDETAILDQRTTLTFPFFAQWFVDGFLRTNQEDFRLTESPQHEINLNQLYGTGEAQTNMLRSGTAGRLKSQIIDGEEYPPFLFDSQTLELKPEFEGLYTEANFQRIFGSASSETKRYAFAASSETKRYAFAVGLETGNSVIGPAMMNTLFLREHNRVAGIIAQAHLDWDDERVFQTTRNCLIVMLLRVTIHDYIYHISEFPLFLGPIGFAEAEKWYRTNWLNVEFNLLYRWHDMIPDSVQFGGTTYDGRALVNNNALILDLGLETLLVDASNQNAGQLVLGNTPASLMPVQRATLEMSRASGLRSYSEYASYFGEPVPESFDDLTGDPELSAKLAAVYDTVDQVEWYVGLFSQGRGRPTAFGPSLLNWMVGYDAMTHIFTNPLVNSAIYSEETFSKEGLEIVESTERLHDFVLRNTRISDKTAVAFGFDRRD